MPRGGGTSLLTLPPEVSCRPPRSQSPPPPRLVTAAGFPTPIPLALKLPLSPGFWQGKGACVGAGKDALAAAGDPRRLPAPVGSTPPRGHTGQARVRAPGPPGFRCPPPRSALDIALAALEGGEYLAGAGGAEGGLGAVEVLCDRVNHSLPALVPFAAAATWGVGAAWLCGVLKPDSELLRIGFQCR